MTAAPLPTSHHVLTYISIERVDIFNRFASDFSYANEKIITGRIPSALLKEFLDCYAPAVFLAIFFVAVTSTYLVHTAKKLDSSSRYKRSILIGAELLSVTLAILPTFLPFKFLRFFFGLIAFVFYMALHSHIVSSVPINRTFLSRLLNIFSFNTREFLLTKRPTLPSRATLFRWLCLVFLTDTCTFLTNEVVPVNITGQTNQTRAAAVLIGYWIYVSMEFHYTQTLIFCDCIGSPVPMSLRHKNPFLSISLSEFWAVRWNPVICKLLQTSFYVPIRKLGVSRMLGVVACFTGSGILHAFPVYISTNSVKSAAMMGSFFILMGFLVLLEQAFFALMCWTDKPAPRVINTDNKANNNTNGNTSNNMQVQSAIKKDQIAVKETEDIVPWTAVIPYISDLCEATGVAGLLYCLVENKCTSKNIALFSMCLLVTLCTVVYVQLPKVIEVNNRIAVRDAVIINLPVIEEPKKIEDIKSEENEKSETSRSENETHRNHIELHQFSSSNIFSKPILTHESYTSVTDIGHLSQTSSRNTSFTNSEKYLQNSSEKQLIDAAKKLLAEFEPCDDIVLSQKGDILLVDKGQISINVNNKANNEIIKYLKTSLFIAAGWLWTILVIAVLLPLFTLPVYDILDTMLPQSFFVGPLVRTLQYAGWV